MTPVALFVFKRVQHTKQTLLSLSRNFGASEVELFVFSDGPKSDDDVEQVQAVRKLCREQSAFRKLHLFERSTNSGLAKSIISGVNHLLSDFPSLIVLEDDMVTSPFYLRFMQTSLEKYKDENRVASIHGYSYPAKDLPSSYFLRGSDCWGWATWKGAWQCFNPNAAELLDSLTTQNLLSRFDLDGAYRYSEMLRKQAAGEIDSWAIRWHASTFLKDMLTLHPGHSFVENIGVDGTGTHFKTSADQFRPDSLAQEIPPWPNRIAEDETARNAIADYLAAQQPFRYRIKYHLRQFLNNLRENESC